MLLATLIIIIFLLSLIRTTQAMPIIEAKSRFECSYCDRKFTRGRNLLNHQKTIHGTSSIVVSCPVCGKTFKSFHLLEKV
jgi:uncharacterized Zn-finger protein